MACFDSPELDQADTAVQDEYSRISREQFEDYTKRYEGTLTSLIDEASDPNYVSDQVTESVSGVGDQFKIAGTNVAQTNERYRKKLTPRQQKAQQSMLKLGETTATNDAANRTRVNASDRQDALRTDLIRIGQGMKGEALNNYDAVASLENRRGQANLQAETQRKQGTLNLLGQAAGTAGSIFMLSDRTKKHAVVKADTASHLDEIKGLKLKNYEYDDGIDPKPKRRTGVMYQETPSLQAPKQNGRVLDLGDWNAKNSGAIQELDKKLERVVKVLQLRVA